MFKKVDSKKDKLVNYHDYEYYCNRRVRITMEGKKKMFPHYGFQVPSVFQVFLFQYRMIIRTIV